MTDFSLEYVAKVCPELVRSEVEAVHDHVIDTHRPNEIYPGVVKQAARSLFPYQAAPADNVRFIDGRDSINAAVNLLRQVDELLSRTKNNDDVAQVQLDVQCCIHYLSAEVSRMESTDGAV